MWHNSRAHESLLTAATMLGLDDCGCEYYFILIYLFFWMSKHIHHRTTEDIMHLWSQARATQSVSTVCGSELEWWANSYDTATIALGLFRFIDDSIKYECHLCSHRPYSLPFAQLHTDSLHRHHHSVEALHAGCHCVESYHLPTCLHLYSNHQNSARSLKWTVDNPAGLKSHSNLQTKGANSGYPYNKQYPIAWLSTAELSKHKLPY